MLQAFHECFRLGLELANQEASDSSAARAKVLGTLAEAERTLAARRGPEVSATARRMVTVWLDELLIQAPWPGRELWLQSPLQSEWGEGRSGGLWFFQRLESLRPARRDERELAALALRCLSLGLCGCYGREPERLNQLRRELQARFGFQANRPGLPSFQPPEKKAPPASATWKIVGLGAALPFLFWLGASLSLEHTLRDLSPEPPAIMKSPQRPDGSLSLYGRLEPLRDKGL